MLPVAAAVGAGIGYVRSAVWSAPAVRPGSWPSPGQAEFGLGLVRGIYLPSSPNGAAQACHLPKLAHLLNLRLAGLAGPGWAGGRQIRCGLGRPGQVGQAGSAGLAGLSPPCVK